MRGGLVSVPELITRSYETTARLSAISFSPADILQHDAKLPGIAGRLEGVVDLKGHDAGGAGGFLRRSHDALDAWFYRLSVNILVVQQNGDVAHSRAIRDV